MALPLRGPLPPTEDLQRTKRPRGNSTCPSWTLSVLLPSDWNLNCRLSRFPLDSDWSYLISRPGSPACPRTMQIWKLVRLRNCMSQFLGRNLFLDLTARVGSLSPENPDQYGARHPSPSMFPFSVLSKHRIPFTPGGEDAFLIKHLQQGTHETFC